MIIHAFLKTISQAKFECDTLCDLRLRVNALLRDIYFAGMYKSLLPEDKAVISEELVKLKSHMPTLFENVSHLPEIDALTDPQKALEKEKEFHNIYEVKCVFCSVSKLVDKEIEFVIHPYVPKNFRNKSIYLCSNCIESWHVYRQSAHEENNLILPDETNEDLCAICSDTPPVSYITHIVHYLQ